MDVFHSVYILDVMIWDRLDPLQLKLILLIQRLDIRFVRIIEDFQR